MWPIWLVFCDCGFHSVCPFMDKDKRLIKALHGRDWLWRKLGLVLMGGAMLSKSLIQFSVDGWGSVCSLLFGLRPHYGGGNVDNVDFLQKVPCTHWHTQCLTLQATSGTHLHRRLLDTHRQVWAISSWITASLFWVLVHTRFCLCPPRVCFPSPVFYNQIPLSSKVKFSGGAGWGSVPLPDSLVGKSVVGPRTFLTVHKFLCYNCYAVFEMSARWLSSGVNGDLQEGLCHKLCEQVAAPRAPAPAAGHCWPIPLQQTQTQVWLSLCRVYGSWCTQGFVWALWASQAQCKGWKENFLLLVYF